MCARLDSHVKMAREVSRFSARRRDSTTKGGGGDNFKVAVRVRPLIAQELRAKAISVSQSFGAAPAAGHGL